MRICIFGVGAIGGYIAGHLAGVRDSMWASSHAGPISPRFAIAACGS
jgi:hypothetical protein